MGVEVADIVDGEMWFGEGHPSPTLDLVPGRYSLARHLGRPSARAPAVLGGVAADHLDEPDRHLAMLRYRDPSAPGNGDTVHGVSNHWSAASKLVSGHALSHHLADRMALERDQGRDDGGFDRVDP